MLILLQIVFIFMLSSPLQAFELEGWWMTNENVIQEMKIIHFPQKHFKDGIKNGKMFRTEMKTVS